MAAQSTMRGRSRIITSILLLGATSNGVVSGAAVREIGPNEPALVRRARNAEQDLMRAWRREWLVGYQNAGDNDLRSAAGHCHFDGGGYDTPPHIIYSGTRRSICPTWYSGREEPIDEANGIDEALRPDARARMHARRAAVLDLLDSASTLEPYDQSINDQRVRFAVDQRDAMRAARAARECRGALPWCALLGAYVADRFGSTVSADSAIDRALAAMPLSDRCAWSDVRAILDADERSEYASRSCAEKLKIDPTFWWLTDPLWSRPGNERRVEHFARVVEVALRAELRNDERFDWRREKGATALSELVVRYGWPAFVGWLGLREDDGHRSWLRFDDAGLAALSPEYGLPRVHTVPPLRAVSNPTLLARDDWREISPTRSGARWDLDWWPDEHMSLDGATIRPVTDQTATFRRAGHGVLAIASQMPRDSATADPTYSANVVVSSAPDSFVTDRRKLSESGRVTALLPVNDPAVVSIELVPDQLRGGTIGRSRFGVVPLSALDELASGEIALSELALFAPSVTAPPPSSLETLRDVMLPSTTVDGRARLGVFWEIYGLRAADTVDVSLRVEREDSSLWQRLAARVGISDQTKAAVDIRWKEPRVDARGEGFMEAGRLVLARSVVIGLAALEPGSYRVSLRLERGGAPAAVSERLLEVR